MSLVATSGGGTDFRPAPAGTHVARCIQVIDLGTQHTEYKGKPKVQRKVLIGWELPDEPKENGEPFILWERYTCSLNEMAIMRQHLQAWRGREFTDEELKSFHLENILDKPCMLSITQNTKNGKTYANVAGVAALPKGLTCPPRHHQLILFDLAKPDWTIFETFGDRLKMTIQSSDEWKTIAKPARPNGQVGGGIDEADIPF